MYQFERLKTDSSFRTKKSVQNTTFALCFSNSRLTKSTNKQRIMPQELLLQVSPEIAANDLLLKNYLSKQIKVSVDEIQHVSILKRSIDAR